MKKLLIFLLGLSLVSMGIFFFYSKGLEAKDPVTEEVVEVTIPPGSSGKKVVKILDNNNLLKNDKCLEIYLKLNKIDDLKAGIYNLSSNMTSIELIEALQQGGKDENLKTVTIPEGFELKEIIEKLSTELNLSKDKLEEITSDKEYFEDQVEFLKELEDGQSLEGYLYPCTYEFKPNVSEEEAVLKLLKEFEKVYMANIKDYEGNIQGINMNMNDIVTLASIIEREAVLDEEKTLISGVFYNRLNQNINLGSCATVQYILGERKENLSIKDTRIESDYNTYINPGLPPAPIASVSLGSLRAAAQPEETDYLYFRSKEDGTGGHNFSKTYEEHKEADPKKKED